MPTPILDDFDRPRFSPRNNNLWFIAGIGMAILLQAVNLSRHYVNWPDVLVHWGHFYLSTSDAFTLLILSTGTCWLSAALLRGAPGLASRRIARDAFGAGVLAEGFTQLVKFASVSDFSGLLWTALMLLGVGTYCAAIGVGFFAYRQGRGCLPGVVFFIATVLAVGYFERFW